MDIKRLPDGRIEMTMDQDEYAVLGASVAYSAEFVIPPLGHEQSGEEVEWSASVRQVCAELVAFHRENPLPKKDES